MYLVANTYDLHSHSSAVISCVLPFNPINKMYLLANTYDLHSHSPAVISCVLPFNPINKMYLVSNTYDLHSHSSAIISCVLPFNPINKMYLVANPYDLHVITQNAYSHLSSLNTSFVCIFLCVLLLFCCNIQFQSVQLHVHVGLMVVQLLLFLQEETQLQAKPSERATGFVPTK